MRPADSPYLVRAAQLAARGWPAPNPRVGCVIVAEGRIVGEGHHERKGAPHAEAVALQGAGPAAKGGTAYVTLEPCAHHGLTPPCTLSLIEAGVRRVVYAEPDPNPQAAGGADILGAARVEVVHEPCPDAAAVNTAFLTAHRLRRPYVTVKAAVTADGFMARLDGTSKWITGEAARAAGHGLRAESGAVLVGAATAVLDSPSLTVRAFSPGWQPRRLVLDPRRRVRPDSPLFAGEPAQRIVSAASAKEGEIGVHERDGVLDLAALLSELFGQGVTSLLVEGGPSTIQRFGQAGLVDRFDLFSAPGRFVEGRRVEVPPGLELARVRGLEKDVWATFVRPGELVAVPAWERTLRT